MTNTVSEPLLSFAAKTENALRPSPSQDSRTFEEISSAFWNSSENASAVSFLSSLSSSELSVVQQEHHLAAPISNIRNLNVEQANNLLRAAGETIDENRDGIDSVGLANLWRFPNSNTPADVEAAWNEATEGMSEGDKMLMAGILFMPLPQIVQDPLTGAITEVINPGDPGYQDQSLRAGYSYNEEVQSRLRSLDDPSSPPVNLDFYKKAKAFYGHLLETFEAHGIA